MGVGIESCKLSQKWDNRPRNGTTFIYWVRQHCSMAFAFDEGSLRIVAHLLTHFDENQYLRKIAKESGVPRSTASRILEALAGVDIVTKTRSGNQMLFRLNPKSPLALNLCSMALSLRLESVRPRDEVAYKEIVSFADSCSKAIDELGSVVLFGSAARGERARDLDMLVIAPLEHTKRIEEIAHTISASYTKRLSPTIVDSEAFGRELDKGNLLYLKIIREGIPVYGGESYLKKIFAFLEKR